MDREVRLIDEDGNQVGVVPTQEALKRAESKSLDLVKISPQAIPPVCKIINYGKFRFELIKKEKEAKKNQKVVELKEVQLSATIDIGDINVKAKQAIKFFEDGNKAKVCIKMRGRQQARPEISLKVMDDFFEIVKDYAVMEKRPILEGRNITMILAPTIKK